MVFYVMLNLRKLINSSSWNFQADYLLLELTEGDYGKHIWDSPLVVTTSDQYFKVRLLPDYANMHL